MGTSSLIDKNSIIIGHDYDLGIDNALWKPIHTNRIVYKNSKTGNLNKLTFTITYEDGSKINLIDQDSNNIIGKNITGISQDYIAFVDSNSSVESVAYTDGVTQVLYNITVGIIEAEMKISRRLPFQTLPMLMIEKIACIISKPKFRLIENLKMLANLFGDFILTPVLKIILRIRDKCSL
jgi:hypothetical protein